MAVVLLFTIRFASRCMVCSRNPCPVGALACSEQQCHRSLSLTLPGGSMPGSDAAETRSAAARSDGADAVAARSAHSSTRLLAERRWPDTVGRRGVRDPVSFAHLLVEAAMVSRYGMRQCARLAVARHPPLPRCSTFPCLAAPPFLRVQAKICLDLEGEASRQQGADLRTLHVAARLLARAQLTISL